MKYLQPKSNIILVSVMMFSANILLPSFALAAPLVTSAPSIISDGASVTISGNSFGTKTPAKPYLWAPFNSGSINPSSLGIVTSWDGVGGMALNASEGVNGTGCSKAIDSSGDWTMAVVARGFAWNDFSQQMYLYRKIKENFTIDGSLNWKNWRLWPASVGTAPDMHFSSSNYTCQVEGINMPVNAALNSNSRGTPNTWRTEEIVVKSNSTSGSTDATFQLWVNGLDAGHLPYTSYETKTLTMNDGSGSMVTNVVVHGVKANTTFPSDYRYWADDVYVDTTWARVMIGDASTWSASTHKEIQIPSAWSLSSASITVNQGTFTNGSQAWIYVIDSAGAASNGYPITFGGGGGGGGDTTSPTVSIAAPQSGATVSGTATVTASASDNVGVNKVEFYVDSTSTAAVATVTAAPYSFNWNSITVVNGSHTLYAKAYDTSNNTAISSAVSVTVSNSVGSDTTAPVVSITSPGNGVTVSNNVEVSTTASDNVGVTKVDFYVDSATTPAVTATSLPYTFTWNSTTVADGTHSIYAKASDSAGNVGTSSVTVTVSNTIAAGTYSATFGNTSDSNYPNTVEDTFIDINTTVNATKTLLSAYTWPTNVPANAILMKWNLSALPANAHVQSSTLQLYMNYMESGGGDALYTIPVHKIINKAPVISKVNGYYHDGTNPWDPSNIPYNSVPLAQADILPAVDTQHIDKTIGYKSWDVTNIVKDWVASPESNYGLLLNGSLANSADSNRGFGSSRATDPTQRPKLVVTYTIGPPQVKNLGVTIISK